MSTAVAPLTAPPGAVVRHGEPVFQASDLTKVYRLGEVDIPALRAVSFDPGRSRAGSAPPVNR